MAEAGWYNPGPIKPRNVSSNPRCPDCKSDDPSGGAPMFHPEHKWGPCIVILRGRGACPCTAHEQAMAS